MFHIIKTIAGNYCVYSDESMSKFNEGSIDIAIDSYYKYNFMPYNHDYVLDNNTLLKGSSIFGRSIIQVDSLKDVKTSYPEFFI